LRGNNKLSLSGPATLVALYLLLNGSAETHDVLCKAGNTRLEAVRLASSSIRVPVAVPVSGVTGLMFDFDLQRSITIDSSGNYIVNPVISAFVTDNSGPGRLEDTLGQIVFQRDRCSPSWQPAHRVTRFKSLSEPC